MITICDQKINLYLVTNTYPIQQLCGGRVNTGGHHINCTAYTTHGSVFTQ